jgi:hypothetical protein
VTHSAKVTGKPAGFNGAKARAVKLADKIAKLEGPRSPAIAARLLQRMRHGFNRAQLVS